MLRGTINSKMCSKDSKSSETGMGDIKNLGDLEISILEIICDIWIQRNLAFHSKYMLKRTR